MRTTDDLQDPEQFKGFGEKVTPAKPSPAPAPAPQGKSGIVYENGRARTTTHPKPWEPLTLGADAQLEFLP